MSRLYRFKYQGRLEAYSEQGEIYFSLLQDLRGMKASGYYDLNWAFIFNKQKAKVGQITIWQEKRMVYQGPWTYSSANTTLNNYFPSPEEIEAKTWLQYCQQECWAQIYTNIPVRAEEVFVSLDGNQLITLEHYDKTLDLWIKLIEGYSLSLREGEAFRINNRGDPFKTYKSYTTKRVEGLWPHALAHSQLAEFITEDGEKYRLIKNIKGN